MKSVIIWFLSFYLGFFVYQTAVYPADNYADYIDKGDYKGALKEIMKRIDEIYATRVDDKRLPTDFITLGTDRQVVNINKLFRERRAELFFIEDNAELYSLHSAAGKCFYETREYDQSLSHYYQALRFRTFRYDGEDMIFYGIAQANLKKGNFQGYLDALETAASVNDRNLNYSMELGRALYRTPDKKRAIYHLEKYAQAKGNGLAELDVLIMLAGLYEDINRHLDTEKYYRLYLDKKPDDGFIHYALGFAAFRNTGNYKLAAAELRKAIELLPEKEIYKKSKAYEYLGDMMFATLKFDEAISAYVETIKYQDMVRTEIENNDREIIRLNDEIRKIKAILLKEKNYVQYNEYQLQMQDREKILSSRRERKYEYEKLNPGKSRWNIADCYERKERLEDAISYYRQAVTFSYQPNEAREKIIKLQLKIKRGY
jgi:tetratricopeptide (TPR) repeat protein